jgi:hypothetical protein
MKGSSSADKLAVASALIVNIFAVFIFSSGARKYLIWIISLPLAFLFLYFIIKNTLPIGDATYFSNPLVVAICTIFLSFVQEKIQTREFMMRKLALWRRDELELQIQKVNGLNKELNEVLGDKEGLIRQLQHALDEIKQLSGLLPICATCKKIRDDKGYWEQIETFVQKHSGVSFSHGICPDCLKKHYPDHAADILGKKILD